VTPSFAETKILNAKWTWKCRSSRGRACRKPGLPVNFGRLTRNIG